MTKPLPDTTTVKVDDLGHATTGYAHIRRDMKAPERIYMSITPFSSMTEEQALELADALVDTVESPIAGTADKEEPHHE